VLTDASGDRAAVCVGPSVHLLFSTAPVTAEEQALHAGVHICVYITNFRQAYETLQAHKVIWTNPRFMVRVCNGFEHVLAAGISYLLACLLSVEL
jgi:hypothetical protein